MLCEQRWTQMYEGTQWVGFLAHGKANLFLEALQIEPTVKQFMLVKKRSKWMVEVGHLSLYEAPLSKLSAVKLLEKVDCL